MSSPRPSNPHAEELMDASSDDESTETPVAQGRKRAAHPAMSKEQSKIMRRLNDAAKAPAHDLFMAQAQLSGIVGRWAAESPVGQAIRGLIQARIDTYRRYQNPTSIATIAAEWSTIRTSMERYKTILAALDAFGLEKLELVDESVPFNYHTMRYSVKTHERAELASKIHELESKDKALVERIAQLKELLATRDAWLAANPKPGSMDDELLVAIKAGVVDDSPQYAAVQATLAKIAELEATIQERKAKADAQRKLFRQHNRAADKA